MTADDIKMIAELDGQKCGLDHRWDNEKKFPNIAVNWFNQPMVDGGSLQIPICAICADELALGQNGGNFRWHLLICKCGATHWLPKALARKDWPDQVYFLTSCPECKSKTTWGC